MNTTKILIATDGYLKDKVVVKKLNFIEDDEEILKEYESLDDYVEEMIFNETAEYRQAFCQTIVLSPEQVEILKTQL